MPYLKLYSVFISHAWPYDGDYHRLVDLLNVAPYFSWRNMSVPEHDPRGETGRRLRAGLANQIRPANIVLIISGMYVNYSRWIQEEMDIAYQMDKPIVGLIPRGALMTPTQVQNVAEEMVGWTTSSIVAAIRWWAI